MTSSLHHRYLLLVDVMRIYQYNSSSSHLLSPPLSSSSPPLLSSPPLPPPQRTSLSEVKMADGSSRQPLPKTLHSMNAYLGYELFHVLSDRFCSSLSFVVLFILSFVCVQGSSYPALSGSRGGHRGDGSLRGQRRGSRAAHARRTFDINVCVCFIPGNLLQAWRSLEFSFRQKP